MLKNMVKLVVTACTIVLIAGLMITFDSLSGVKSADADILAFNFGPKSNTQKFQDSLADLGMEKPRQYDWNGNKMFFSTMVTDDPPLVVLDRFQREFAKKGLNEKAYTGMSAAHGVKKPADGQRLSNSDRAKVFQNAADNYEKYGNFFTGGVIPIEVGEDYVQMAGMDSKKGAQDPIDFFEEVKERRSSRLTDSVGAARVIEAFREQGKTRVTATWTDDEVDFAKFRNASNAAEVGGSAKVPACMGCDRKMRFEGEKGDEGYVSSLFESRTMTKSDVVSFYKRSMANRGWELTEASRALEAAEIEGIKPKTSVSFLSFARLNEFVTMMVYVDDEGRTITKVMESP